MAYKIMLHAWVAFMLLTTVPQDTQAEFSVGSWFLCSSIPSAIVRNVIPGEISARCVADREIDSFLTAEFPRDLVSLRLYNCVIRNFESIRALRHLRELHVRNCGLANISPIASLANLSHLSLAENKVVDIGPLANCKGLSWIDLRDNDIRDLSPLRVLDGVVCLDIRNNPRLDLSTEKDIRAIARKGPDTKVLFGSDPNMLRGHTLRRLLSAKAEIANFAIGAQWDYYDNYPRLPTVSDQIGASFLLLRQAGDREYTADVASVLMRYAAHILAGTHTGTLLSERNPLVVEFLSIAPRREIGGDEILTGAIARWVTTNRDRISPSVVLDAYIKAYQRVEGQLEEEFEELSKEIHQERKDEGPQNDK